MSQRQLLIWDGKYDWYGFSKKHRRIIFLILSVVFYGLPALGIDKWTIIIQLEQIIGVIHPSILYASELPHFGSRAALLLLFINFMCLFYVIHAFLRAICFGRYIKSVTYFEKIKTFILSTIFVFIGYFGMFYALAYPGEYPSIIDEIIESNELVFFIFTSYLTTICAQSSIPYVIAIAGLFRLKE